MPRNYQPRPKITRRCEACGRLVKGRAGIRFHKTCLSRAYQMRYPGRGTAKTRVNHAVRTLKLIKALKCESCGLAIPLVGHHDDYGLPLQVRWLCRSCHKRHHVALRPIEAPSIVDNGFCRYCGANRPGARCSVDRRRRHPY